MQTLLMRELKLKLGIAEHTYSLNTWKVEGGGSVA